MPTKQNESEINRLVNIDPTKVQAPALKAALELHRKQVEEREAKQALERISEMETIVNRQVERLRAIRQQERDAKENLVKLIAAKEQFFKDGDWAAFVKVYHGL